MDMATPKLKLPDVTLVCVETREHELARMAIEDCLAAAEFGDVLILTDKPDKFTFSYRPGQIPRVHIVPDWPEKIGWSRAWWFEVPPLLRTRQTLNIQWDSWIVEPSMWRDEFLDYDYIGAPWWYKDGKNVGNGGFSLVSTRLKRYVSAHRDKYPCDTSADDDLLCRKYRPQLEEAGFVWAPEHIAHDFAFECCRPSPTHRSFGFHALFNWGAVLDEARLRERIEAVLRSPQLGRPESYQLKFFCERNPQLVKELLKEAGQAAE